jgi:prepilin-type N-terminal cleavage/methylation domain-containing protein
VTAPAARRGFTMLETVLAVAVGSLVVAAAFGMIATVRTSERSLADQSRDMNELARVQLAVRDAFDNLHAAPPGTIRGAMGDASDEAADAVLNTAFPSPIPGVAARLEMTTGANPRLEVVLSRPLLDRPPSTEAETVARADQGSLAVITAEQLPGHRGAFELRRDPSEPLPALWWVPLPPGDIPAGVVFDDDSLPRARKLCGAVRSLTWTAFIDSERVPLVRAIEKSQLPAYIELEIETAGGGYGNWMFELGWTIGPELEAPPTEPDADDDTAADSSAPSAGEEPTEFDNESGDPGVFDPDRMRFVPEERG